MFTRALPNIFTVGNLLMGVLAILLAFQNSWQYAAIMVIIGMLFDGLDGRVARMLKTQSEFGKELDSLSDVITFGVAPAVIMYVSTFKYTGLEGWVVTAIFPICGALRLARFNVNPGEPGYFIGLPIPAAGCIMAAMALYKEYIPNTYILMGFVLLLSFLMVSQIKYPTFKKMELPKVAWVLIPLFLIAVAVSAFLFPHELPKVMIIPLIIYMLYGVKVTFEERKRRDENDEPMEEMK